MFFEPTCRTRIRTDATREISWSDALTNEFKGETVHVVTIGAFIDFYFVLQNRFLSSWYAAEIKTYTCVVNDF